MLFEHQMELSSAIVWVVASIDLWWSLSFTISSCLFTSISGADIKNSPEGGQEACHGPLRVQGDDVSHVEEARRADDLPHGDRLRLLLGRATTELFSLGGRGQAPRAWLTSLLLFGHGCCVYCFHFGVLDIWNKPTLFMRYVYNDWLISEITAVSSGCKNFMKCIGSRGDDWDIADQTFISTFCESKMPELDIF